MKTRIAEIRVLLGAYGIDDPEVRTKLEGLAKRSNHRGWWLEHAEHLRTDYLDHISLEDDATHIRVWAQALVPGLLQTPAYAESVITDGPDYVDPERVGQTVKVREARQSKIEAGGAAYTAIIWEPVIIHPLVPTEVHREQLARILEVGDRKNVTVQVLPLSAGTLAGGISAFASFSFDTGPVVEAVTLENLRGTSILEAPEDLAAYTLAFDQLRSAALAPDASVQLIQRALQRSKDDAS